MCLTELNEARGAVGLLKFEPPEALRTLEKLAPENENVKDDPVWGPVCTVLLQVSSNNGLLVFASSLLLCRCVVGSRQSYTQRERNLLLLLLLLLLLALCRCTSG